MMVTVVAGLEDMAVVRQLGQQCRGQLGIAEHGRPFREAQVGGDDQSGTVANANGERDGGQGQNRTADTRIFSPLLYQLSYLARPVWGWDPRRAGY